MTNETKFADYFNTLNGDELTKEIQIHYELLEMYPYEQSLRVDLNYLQSLL